MGESILIPELKITEKQLENVYNLIKSNNALIVEYYKLRKHVDYIEKEIGTNNGNIRLIMENIPAQYSEASVCALYEEIQKGDES